MRRRRLGAARAPAGRTPPPHPVRPRATAAETRRRFASLSAEIRRCRRCPLGASRSHAVVYRGSLTPRVVFVGEAPGAEEDRQGVPFVGRSGRLLDQAVRSLGPPVGPWGVLNLLKCRPPENRFDLQAARTCRPYLDRQLALLNPRVVVTLGGRALAALDPEALRVLEVAGAPRRSPVGWLFPLVHPAATLRSKRLKGRWEADLAALHEWLAGPALEML